MSRWRNPDEFDEDDLFDSPELDGDDLLDADDAAPFYEDPEEIERLIEEELGSPRKSRRRRL